MHHNSKADQIVQILNIINGFTCEIKDPLSSIHLGMQSFKATIYQLRKACEGRGMHTTYEEKLKCLENIVPIIEKQLEYINLIIELQAQNTSSHVFDKELFAQHSMAKVVSQTLENYPLMPSQQPLVHWSEAKDFIFW